MLRHFLTLILTLPVCSVSLLAESISGTVTDPQGKPVAGIQLILFRGAGVLASAITNQQGSYSFADLTPGTYSILIRQLGFQQERNRMAIEPGQGLVHDITLQLEILEEQVTVTATRTSTPASLLGNSVTILTEEEIEAQNATSVAELLRNVPALNVVQTGGRGSLTSVFLRGGESDYTKIFLDGIPLNQPGGAVNLSNLSSANIDRIEIVRGPQSALYGSDAISGVIQIFTKKPETAAPQFDVFVEGGAYETGRGGAAVRGQAGKLSYSTAFEHLSTDNRVPNNFFHNNTFSTSLGFETSSNSSLNFVGRIERGRLGVPSQTAFGSPEMEEFSRKRDFAAGLSWNHRLSNAWQQRFSYTQSYINQLSVDSIDSGLWVPEFRGNKAPFPAFDFVFSFLDATRKQNFNYQSDFFLSTHLLSAGFDWEEQRGTVGAVRAERTNLGYYLQDQFLVSHRLAITGGVRLEDHDSFGFAVTPRITTAYVLREGGADEFWGGTRTKFNFGLGIKEPTFVESFSESPFFRGNPDLDPERTTSFEIGLEQAIAANRLLVEINSFYNQFDDQIAFQVVNPETFEGSFFNIAESQAWGGELVLGFQPEESFHVWGGYTYLNTRVLESASPFQPVFQEGAPLLRRPTHSGFLAVTWRSGKWILNSNTTFAGNRADSDFRGLGLTQAEGFTKWDLSGSYRITPDLELYATFENVLNQEYFEVLGFPALLFNFRSGLRFTFSR